MASLIAKSAFAGLGLPVTHGNVTLSEGQADPIWSIAPYPGQAKAIAKAMKPLKFPAPGRFESAGSGHLVWAGRDTAFVIGSAPPDGLDTLAAVTDQSDGWACLSLSGAGAEDVLARLIVIDPRLSAFPVGASAKLLLNHMQALVWRVETHRFDMLVFRSMARTAVHELTEAMHSLNERGVIGRISA